MDFPTSSVDNMAEILSVSRSSPKISVDIVLAKRRDGSIARMRSVPKPGKRGVAEQRLVLNLASAGEFFVGGLTQSVTTMPLSSDLVRHCKKRPECSGSVGATDEGTILGYDTFRVVEYTGGPENRLRTERWLAPALGRFELKTVYSHGNSEPDSFFIVNVREAVQVTIGEPAADLFEKPAGYVERSPSARSKEFYNR